MPELFISYKRGTIAVAPLMEKLEAAGYDLWWDRDDIHLGDVSWKSSVEQGIQQSNAVILNLTPAACASESVQYEVKQAQRLGKLIFPIVLEKIENLSAGLTQVGLTPDHHTEDFTDVTRWSEQVQRLLHDLEIQGLRVDRSRFSPNDIRPKNVDPLKGAVVQGNFALRIMRDPAAQAVIGIISIILSIVLWLLTQQWPQSVSSILPTPATPAVIARRDLEIRSGPSSLFPRLDILPVGTGLDILGISEDRTWYQILLFDGNTGWVLASANGAEFVGNRAALRVVVPTSTISLPATNSAELSRIPSTTSTAPASAPMTVTIQLSETPALPTATQIPLETISSTESLVEAEFILGPPSEIVNGYAYIRVPAGEFTDQYGTAHLEFSIGIYEVTNLQFAAFLNSLGGNLSSDGKPLFIERDSDVKIYRSGGAWHVESGFEDHPIVRVTWYGARDFCHYIGGRLPTPTEWHKAAAWDPLDRKIRRYPWGDAEPSSDLVNFNSLNSGTVSVDMFPSGLSAAGAYQLAGNVSEWVNYRQGINRFRMGGGWKSTAAQLRTDAAEVSTDTFSSADSGIRCAR